MDEIIKRDEILKFPCEFMIKVTGINDPSLTHDVNIIIRKFYPEFDEARDLSFKLSKNGNYLAISATINATSRDQLDNIYRALNAHELVKITL